MEVSCRRARERAAKAGGRAADWVWIRERSSVGEGVGGGSRMVSGEEEGVEVDEGGGDGRVRAARTAGSGSER